MGLVSTIHKAHHIPILWVGLPALLVGTQSPKWRILLRVGVKGSNGVKRANISKHIVKETILWTCNS